MSIVYVSRITITGEPDQVSDFAQNHRSFLTHYLSAQLTRAAQEEDAVEFVSIDKGTKVITVDAPHVRGDSLTPHERFLSHPELIKSIFDNIQDAVHSDNSYFLEVATRNWDFAPVINYLSKQYPELLFQHWIDSECDDGYDVYVLRNGIVLEYIHYVLVPDVSRDKPQVQIDWRYHVPHHKDYLDIKVIGIDGKVL